MDAHLVEAAVIGWSPQLVLTRAEGACELVLGTGAGQLVGRPLAEVLHVGEGRARALDARARAGEGRAQVDFVQAEEGVARGETRTTWRLTFAAAEGGEVRAGVLKLQGLLAGAPPLQISALSSSLSHEIRNPLSSVKMAVQTLARNTGLNDRDKRRLTIANREIRTMERMLWLLSEYGRDTPPVLEPTPLRTLLQEAVGMVAPELAERRIELEVDEPEGLPRARVDLNRLRPVLSQVLLNVAMGQPEDSRVQVALRADAPGRVALRIQDPAAALPPEEEGTLFEPFGSRVARGAGLSLAALRRVLLNQDGNVTAEPGDGPGLVFTLHFPAVSP